VSGLVLVGVSHLTAPVEWREKLAVPEEALPEFLKALRPGLDEAVALSTCNRTEVYASVRDPRAGGEFLREALLRWHGDVALDSCLYTHGREDAVRHLFRVASGLESLVVGEAEILGQVKRAYDHALRLSATGKLTNVLFQRAMYVGKLVRTRTAVSEGPTSVPSVAVSVAQRIFGDLSSRRVLVVGAGAMAEQAARALAAQRPAELTVVNRTAETARSLAAQFAGRAAPFENVVEEVVRADVALFSTGSPDPLLRRADLERALPARKGRPLFVIDIAVPRDVEADVHRLENVYLYNVDDLKTLVDESLARRRADLDRAGRLVDQLAGDFYPWYKAWEAGEPATLKHRPRESHA
jgi:glutamyl-tRNA reductase